MRNNNNNNNLEIALNLMARFLDVFCCRVHNRQSNSNEQLFPRFKELMRKKTDQLGPTKKRHWMKAETFCKETEFEYRESNDDFSKTFNLLKLKINLSLDASLRSKFNNSSDVSR